MGGWVGGWVGAGFCGDGNGQVDRGERGWGVWMKKINLQIFDLQRLAVAQILQSEKWLTHTWLLE